MFLKTSKQHLTLLSRRFKSAGFSDPEKEALALLAVIEKKTRAELLTNPDKKLSLLKAWRLNYFLRRRLRGWSLAVLDRKKEFYGREFTVSSQTLIPRPETELLVDLALLESKKTGPETDIIDIGTGSGAIILTLASELKSKAKYHASDISKKALKIAQINGQRFQASINWQQGDLLTPYIKLFKDFKHLIIVANLPYLKPEQLVEPSIKREPLTALVSGTDGLDHYRRLFLQLASEVSLPKSFTLLAEIDPAQVEVLKKLAKASFKELSLSFFKDYSGQNRFFKLTNTEDPQGERREKSKSFQH